MAKRDKLIHLHSSTATTIESVKPVLTGDTDQALLQGELAVINSDELNAIVTLNKEGDDVIEFAPKSYIDEEIKRVEGEITSTGNNALNSVEAGNGVSVTVKAENKQTVSVNLSTGNTENKNFLVLEGDSDGDKTLAVREIDTDKTVLQKEIVIAGIEGVLGTGEYKNGDTIPAGTDVYEIFKKILCKELYPSARVTPGNLTSAFAKPSVKVPSSGATVEVGTSITVPQFVGYDPNNTPTPRKYSGFTYGYSSADDDSKDADGNPSNVNVTGITLNAGDFTITRTYSGFGKSSDPTKTSTNASSTACTIPQDTTPVVEEGSNTVTFSIKGPGHKGVVDASPEYYIVSNLGNTDSVKKVDQQEQQSLSVTAATSASTVYTVTGAYKYFMGYSENTTVEEFDSSSIRALTVKTGNVTKDGSTTVVNATAIKSNGTSIVVACPKKYKLSGVTNGLGASILANFSVSGTVSVQTGTIQTDYTVYIYPITNGAQVEFKNMTLAKA